MKYDSKVYWFLIYMALFELTKAPNICPLVTLSNKFLGKKCIFVYWFWCTIKCIPGSPIDNNYYKLQFHIERINGLMQERRNSIANALELRPSCTNPWRWWAMHGALMTTINHILIRIWGQCVKQISFSSLGWSLWIKTNHFIYGLSAYMTS